MQGHFGEWLQGRLGPAGPVALVTVACPDLWVRTGTKPCAFDAGFRTKAAQALGEQGGQLPPLQANMPIGAGCGASTASLIVWAKSAGFDGGPDALAQLCLSVEGACDPLMLDAPDRHLWLSRQARALRILPPPPACFILGGFWGKAEQTDAADAHFSDVSDLAAQWDKACHAGDLSAAAHIASTSAERCSALRGGQSPIEALAKDLGALGHCRAHTGSARGLIFAAAPPAKARDAMAEAGFQTPFLFQTGGV